MEEMTNTMMKINKKVEKMFNIVHVIDQLYGEVSSDNMHSITYNQDLVSSALLVGWIELREFYGFTKNHQVTLTHYGQSDVPSTMYSFVTDVRFTHLNLKGTMKCMIVYNHHKKIAKIRNG
ncbi:hypothetical protein HKD37_01G000406 [Glycine soja]